MNITDPIAEFAQTRPYDLALLTLTERFVWSDFNNKVNLTAAFLGSHGVCAGQRVAISVRDQVLHLFVSLALARLGAAQIALPPSEPRPVRARLASKLTVFAVIVEKQEDGLENTPAILFGEDRINSSAVVEDQTYVCRGDEPFLILQSSGTTGDPKFSELSHQMGADRFQRYLTYFNTTHADIFWPASRLDFVVAKQRVFYSLMAGAAICVVSGRAIDTELVNFLNKVGVTLGCGTPSHLTQLVGASAGPRCLPKLRAFEVRSATVSESLRKSFKSRVSPNLFIAYATNEVEVATLATPELQSSIADTVGEPVENMWVEVVDNSHNTLTDGEAGQIRISGKGVIDGYIDNPSATAKSFREGWFYPGDIGKFVDGALVFLGRSDDMMIFDGMNIFPIEIENALLEHPCVREVAAFPLRHSRFQDVPTAAVVLHSEANVEELHKHCQRILGSKRPHFIKIMERFPTNAMGKTIKREIRNQIQREIQSSAEVAPDHPAARSVIQDHSDPKVLSFRFTPPLGVDPTKLTPWLFLLDPESTRKTDRKTLARSSKDGRVVWLEQVLLLTKGYLNILGVPLFDEIRILRCRPAEQDGRELHAVCRLPEASRISPALLQGVLKVAFKNAGWLFTADALAPSDREKFFSLVEKDILRQFAKFRPPGKSTFELLRTAHAMGVPFRGMPGGTYQLGWGSRARRIDRSTTDRDSALGSRWARNKLLTAQLLREAGLPAPEHKRATSTAEAEAIAAKLGFPVVVKPADRERGEGVEVDVVPDRLKTAFDTAKRLSPSKTVLVERQVAGVCHRLFIVAGHLLYAVKRLPMGIYADGKTSIADLVARELAIQTALPPWKRSGLRALDDMAAQMLTRQGWTSEAVPPAGTFIALRRIETTAWGGIDEDVTSLVHPDNLKAALAVTSLLCLEVAGVDIITEDITQPWSATDAIINEVNYAPLLGGGDISKRYIPDYLNRILEHQGRIPIHVYVGGPQAWGKAESHWKHLCGSGVSAYLTNDQVTYDAIGETTLTSGEGLGRKLDALRLRKDVQAIIAVLQSVSCLQDVQFLDYATSFEVIDPEPAKTMRNPRELPEATVVNMIRQCQSRLLSQRSRENRPAAQVTEFGN